MYIPCQKKDGTQILIPLTSLCACIASSVLLVVVVMLTYLVPFGIHAKSMLLITYGLEGTIVLSTICLSFFSKETKNEATSKVGPVGERF